MIGVPIALLFTAFQIPTGLLRLVDPDGTGLEVFARGVRNSVGFDWHPTTKQLYFSTHARAIALHDIVGVA